MTLILNNDEIASLLTMDDCLARLEETYRELAPNGQSIAPAVT